MGFDVLVHAGGGVGVDPAVAPLDAGSVVFANAAGQLTEDAGRFGYDAATGLDIRRPTAGDVVLRSRVVGDTADRLTVAADGSVTWGPGNAAGDVTITRTGPPPHLRHKVDGVFGVQRQADTATRWWVDTITPAYSAGLYWGSGTGSVDYQLVLDSATVMRFECPSAGTFRWRFAGVSRLDITSSGLAVINAGAGYHRLFTSSLGFFGVTPVVQQSVVALTDSSGGTASNTIAAAGGTYDATNENNFRASVATKINQIRGALAAYGLVV
jgi:hypothetical protein